MKIKLFIWDVILLKSDIWQIKKTLLKIMNIGIIKPLCLLLTRQLNEVYSYQLKVMKDFEEINQFSNE